MNSVSNSHLRGESYTEGCLGVRGARVWFFLGYLVGFMALMAAIFGMVEPEVYDLGEGDYFLGTDSGAEKKNILRK